MTTEAPVGDIKFLDEVVELESAAPHGTPCPSCGSPIESDDHYCGACGTANPLFQAAHAVEVGGSETQKFFRCENCGSEVATDSDQRSYTCAFCDSTYVVEFARADTERQRPEFIIGFSISREEASQKYRQWMGKNAWFRPGDLGSTAVADKQKGVYLPFWSFSMLGHSQWSATIGEYWYRTETYTTTDSNGKTVTRTRQVRETEWWPLSGRHHRYYSGYLVSGSRGLPQDWAERIKPFNLPALKRYEPYYLAGWLCEEYSVDHNDAKNSSQQEFYRREQANVARFLPGNTHRGLDVHTQFDNINSDLCLLPVYVLTYRYKEKLYRFLVNGQTGKIAGDKPLSWKRISGVLGAIGVLVIIIALIIAFFAQEGR